MQVIRHASAEAVSTDGVHWDIYVSNDELRQGLEGPVQTSDIRYGTWSADTGLKRGPLYPSEDFRRMEEMGAVVYEYLTLAHARVPFPLHDRYEFWLLDRQGLPLALLDSVLPEQAMDLERAAAWRPGMAARERFESPVLAELACGTERPAADVLAEYVHQQAASPASAQWFCREGEGGGTGLKGVNLPVGLEGRRLGAEDFPELLLACSGHDALHRRLIEDFHAWQAVWLLTLPLSASVRTGLEPHVCRQAELVDGLCRLYPDILDRAPINAARVEAMLLAAQGRQRAADQDQMSTFYIELNPAGGHYT